MCCQSRKNLPCFRVWYLINSVFMKNPPSLLNQVSSEGCSSGIDPSQAYVSPQTILNDWNRLSLSDSSVIFYPLPSTLSLPCCVWSWIWFHVSFPSCSSSQMSLFYSWNCIKNVTYFKSRQRTPAQAWVGWKFLYLFQRVWHFLSPVAVLLSL